MPTDDSNPGSFAAMAQVPVATAASGNPVLSTLVSAVKKAGLVDSLNTADALTVFAPANSAFDKIPAGDLKKVLADKKQLTSILTYHVVPGKLAPADLAGTHKTLEGDSVTVTGSGTDFKVGDASVVCGNVQTANATVYIIDSVLMPKS
ncbi:fasciclin domain-containing protein [Actinoplanes sp. N902-109]|uniref:fasciclin domain-containing protein n=1 Tax=Actinoplanes sp. (strain N902-109) TaxID=649831 RepID=UPI001E347AA9|nr:fasciclin domain-containing protein [Actinoplanes sp. N902-109]